MEHYYAVIMAGGGGTRLWPLSRHAKPKQMLSLFDERTLFQTAVERLKGVFAGDQILVVTIAEQAKELQAQCPQIPIENFVIEPMPRGTASVVGLAAVALQKRDPQAVMAILTSDHYIGNEASFRHLLLTAQEVANAGYLVTLGITPGFPCYRLRLYSKRSSVAQLSGPGSFSGSPFQRKTQRRTGRRNGKKRRLFLEFWYVCLACRQDSWMSSTARCQNCTAGFDANLSRLGIHTFPVRAGSCSRVWPGIKNETIDYGVMEGAERVAVIPLPTCSWSDVGSWDSLFEVLPSDEKRKYNNGRPAYRD
jgi:mannose-1-phosphate guanylyltransferase